MDFFAAQDLARRNTLKMIVLLGMAVFAMTIALYIVLVIAVFFMNKSSQPDAAVSIPFFSPLALLGSILLVGLIVGGGSLYKIMELRGGGRSIAELLGGRRLVPNSRDPVERRILNVVEEMALAAGTAVPPVYVLDDEPGINAFAAGYSIDDAVIGVNRGTIELLNRDELQGVIAHEFSHILNGDMRMSIRMIGLLHGIQLLALIGYGLLRFSPRRSRGRNDGMAYILVIGLAMMIVGGVGFFFARLIKFSVSRQREFLADASAVQFTRNPEGIAGALKMIGGTAAGSKILSPRGEVASHMFFGDIGSSFSGLFSTHPPLESRIQKLDPQFNGNFDEYIRSRSKGTVLARSTTEKPKEPPVVGPRMGGVFFPQQMGQRFPIDPAIIVAGVGLPSEKDVEYSRQIVEEIPAEISEAAHESFSARCIVFAALLSSQRELQDKQYGLIEQHEGAETLAETRRLQPHFAKMKKHFRLPVFEILQGTLVGLSPQQYQQFSRAVREMILADDKVSLFEFFLQHHLLVHLDRHFGIEPAGQAKYGSVYVLQDEIILIIGLLAWAGHENDAERSAAFSHAVNVLGQEQWTYQQYMAMTPGSPELTRALDKLVNARPNLKKKILASATAAIMFDGKVTVTEAELFRALAESIDCPIPPSVANQIDSMRELDA